MWRRHKNPLHLFLHTIPGVSKIRGQFSRIKAIVASSDRISLSRILDVIFVYSSTLLLGSMLYWSHLRISFIVCPSGIESERNKMSQQYLLEIKHREQKWDEIILNNCELKWCATLQQEHYNFSMILVEIRKYHWALPRSIILRKQIWQLECTFIA